jgi:hypothetical protein
MEVINWTEEDLSRTPLALLLKTTVDKSEFSKEA